MVHIHKAGTGNAAAGVCNCAKVAARETGCARQHSPLLPMLAAGEAHPEHHGPVHGTRVPWIWVRSVGWDILSTAVLTCYMRAFVCYMSSLLLPINLLHDARCSGSKAAAARVLLMNHDKRNLHGVTPTCTNTPTTC